MEFDVLEIVLGHLKHVVAVGQENVVAFTILGHELILALPIVPRRRFLSSTPCTG